MKARIALLAIPVTWLPLACRMSVPAEGKTITFSVGGGAVEFDFWEKLTREFTAETGIGVALLRKPMDTGLHRQSLVVPLSAKKSDPDVFLMDVAWLAQFAASGWLASLGPNLAKGGCGDRNAFFPRILALADTYEGNLVALPVFIDGGLLYYRGDLLRKYGFRGPPQTLDELLRYAKRCRRESVGRTPGFSALSGRGPGTKGSSAISSSSPAETEASRLRTASCPSTRPRTGRRSGSCAT